VLILKAGARNEIQDFINNEWESFAQLAWIDMRTTSGSWRVGRDFPNRQVGRNHMRHMTGNVYGVFEKPVHAYRGTTMAGIIRDEARHDTRRGFVGGYEMETVSLGVPFMAAFADPGAWGRSFTSIMGDYSHMAGMTSSARPTTSRTCSSPTAVSSPAVRRATRRSPSSRWRSARPRPWPG